jgi:hypothetical protein
MTRTFTDEELDALAGKLRSFHSKPAQAAADALAFLRAGGWLPIETAPTNESVLIYVPSARHYGEGIYRAVLVDMGKGKRWHTSALLVGRDVTPEYTPTHWRPLPPAPEGTK